ncbi:SRPBCC family protein [Actinoplanes utahensis]|uniref:Polyketide cyclase n=1 Tax=Actinoplanes utahensis TaxID=1869 RepID=A0A0A6UKT7_ACTUT|nr:SRPBCC domain-containing protein [Actinoplanes utahensis]KHD76730.1 polyketide cyclase [Actinoplanes utahensis]GIF33207.1 activator of HSP90 ATPase [Actinoplanes utahensis]
MTVISSHKDVGTLSLTFVAEFAAPVDRVWQVWADPRTLERWWGPPGYPATFERYEFQPGGEVRYHMTTPEGTKPRGWWLITAVDEPGRLEFDAGFSGDDGEPLDRADAMHGVVTLEPVAAGTRMTTVFRFRSAEQLERSAGMGMAEGVREAMGQIDDLLTGD